MVEITVYWAGPVFSQAERIWNRMCVEELRRRGFTVILPQAEASRFFGPDGKLDAQSLAENCFRQAVSADVMVAVLDGPDSDSGTSMEIGFRVSRAILPVVGVRTDFRASEDDKLNAMFRLLNRLIIFPSFNESVEELCEEIAKKIREVVQFQGVKQ